MSLLIEKKRTEDMKYSRNLQLKKKEIVRSIHWLKTNHTVLKKIYIYKIVQHVRCFFLEYFFLISDEFRCLINEYFNVDKTEFEDK